ncbi:MAG: DUF4358 domain-containing protein [Lachnospiraceae bacterium]|nr:DUF4358 domain-containing protein [Lachnospiraceae bacterium]
MNKRRRYRLLAVLLAALLLQGCGGKKEKKETLNTEDYGNVSAYEICMSVYFDTPDFTEGGSFGAGFEETSSYFESMFYDAEVAQCMTDFYIVGGEGVVADEVIVAVTDTKEKRDRIEKAFQTRLKARTETFTGYAPVEADKLRRGRVLAEGPYVIYLVSGNIEASCQSALAAIKKGYEPRFGTPENRITPSPDPSNQEPQYHTEGYESGFNPEIVRAYREQNRALLTDPLDLELYDCCSEILADILGDREVTLPEAEKAIYVYVAGQVKYDEKHYSLEGDRVNSDNAYGALVHGHAICTGYSSAFHLLCSMVEIECIDVVGQAHYERNPHGWNMVKIGPYWYQVDPCWGWDGKKEVYFDYFNETSEFFENTEHYWQKSDYPAADTVNYETRLKNGYPDDVEAFDDPEVPKKRTP